MSYGYDYEGYEAYEGDGQYAAEPPSQPDPNAGRGRRRKSAPEPAPEHEPVYPEPGHSEQVHPASAPYDPQWERSGLGWDQEAWNRAQYEQQEQFAPERYDNGYGYESTQYAEPVQEFAEIPGAAEYEPEFDLIPQTAPEPNPAPIAERSPIGIATTDTATATTTPATAGRGAFGAAGLAVVTAIGAIAATPVLAVVIGLSQMGLAIGWGRTVGLPHARRTAIVIAGIGLAAAVLAYRLIPDRAPAAMGAALGAGFVFLAADQLFRTDSAAGWPRSEALAAAVAGAAFTVLPAGYLVAQRSDSALATACALAAAVAVLCSALVGGGVRPIGFLAAAAAATAVGTLTAVTLSASAGAKGGAMGGLISGLFAVIGARTADRLATEGGDVRITAQALPMALSAIGAVIAVQVLR